MLTNSPLFRGTHSLSRYLPARFSAFPRQSSLKPAFARPMSALLIPKVGDVIHGFTVKSVKTIDHFDVTAIALEHLKTKADYLHLARDDPNNVFAVGFKTLSPDKTGIPHVLEHSILCGSEKYPVHDPFFRMLSRSLYTYMNAETWMDFTVYPVSSNVPQGFRNLISVYLDSIYHPLLRKSDFGKECWRLAPTDAAKDKPDPSTSILDRLQIKGVVYNEMKGHLPSPSYKFYIDWKEALFPNNHHSGGDTLFIPDMTHEKLKEFHAEHYHPSNSRIFTYGNLPLEDNLAQIGPELDRFEYRPYNIENMKLVELNGPKVVTSVGPADPMVDLADQHRVSMTWHACLADNHHERFAFEVLIALLTTGYSAPLYKALIESGLAQEYSDDTGFNMLSKTTTVTIGAAGAKKENISKIQSVIRDTLASVSEQGFDAEKIEGQLHQIELRNRIKDAKFGMKLRNKVMSPWINGIDIFEGPQLAELVTVFRERLAAGDYLSDLIKKYLLKDDVLVLIMEPSATFREEWDAQEKKKIQESFEKFAANFESQEEAYQAVVTTDAQMDAEKESFKHEDLSCLPSLTLDDLPLEPPNLRTLKQEVVEGYDVRIRETGTSGITYFRVLNPIEGLTADIRSFIPLFTSAVFRLDTKHDTVEQLEIKRRLYSGRLSVDHVVVPNPENPDKVEEMIQFSGHALDHNVPASLDLLFSIIRDADFDSPDAENKVKEVIKSLAASATSNASYSGHSYASTLAQSRLSYQSQITEEVVGTTQMQLIADLAQQKSIPDVIEKLKFIQKLVVTNFGQLRALIINQSTSSEGNKKAIADFLNKFSPLSSELSLPGDPPFVPTYGNDFIVFPSSTSFAATAADTVPYAHEDSAKVQILAQFISAKHLLHVIRVVGSAYGGGAYTRPAVGHYCTYSYRDPTPSNSLQAFEESGGWMLKHTMNETDLTEAKLALFSSIDAPISVSEEGVSEFVSGMTPELVRSRRRRYFDTTIPDLQEMAKKYLINNEKRSVCILGPAKVIPANKSEWNIRELKIDVPEQKGDN